MNDNPQDPLGLDDPALLAEIEAEFAELTREIERISAMPRTLAPEKTKLVEALRTAWRDKIQVHGDRPEWRQRLDETVGRAVDRLLETGLQENPDGSLAFNLRGDVLQAEGGPLMRGLLDGFAHMLEDKFPAPDKAPKPASDAPPTSPMQALIGSLGQTLVGVLKNAIQNVQTPAAGGDVKVGDGATKLDISVTNSDGESTGGGAANTNAAFTADKKLSATFDLNSKVTTRDANEAQPADTKASATKPAAPNPAANAFFKQLLAGVGQALQQAAAPGPAPAAKAPAPPTGVADAKAPELEGGEAASAKAASAEAKVDNPMANIGQSLLQALQRALGPNAASFTVRATETAHATPEKPASEANGASEAPTNAAETVEPSASSDAGAPADKVAEPKPATLQIDFAGLLQQLLGGKKPPGT